MTEQSLLENDIETALKIEPLEQVIDMLVKNMRDNHFKRIQDDRCTMDRGFILIDLLSNIERISDHCSNIACYIMDREKNNINNHENIIFYRNSEDFIELFDSYRSKYFQ